ncbi:DoxX family protein [Mucilaginibacter pallidiroseus]|uniref:DoxX family protein n=1 Tax=Mucilaginibacter pallidiroseus TaxID=2599295 RepID=A0A563U3D0_9SPHI|nr:DoxX family protein [Mucilaginibacter pallidiroseus]TWR25859.1 DoxX family protein [Mucilaginibacter pallidiroseus]
MQYTSDTTTWLWATKLAFRFFSVFLVTVILLNPNGGIPLPFFHQAYQIYSIPFMVLANWLGKNLYQLSGDLKPFQTGSGDTTLNYLLLLSALVTSIIITAIWSALDYKRRNYSKLLYWVSVIIRYYLATTMVMYGFAKIFKTQFPFPGTYRLEETYGASSPMGLAWTFFGYSAGYNYFMGFAEVLGGVLLFFRRTATFGALVTLAVSANIMMVNYCFDVPVKILSTTLVVLSLFLLAKDVKRLFNFFVMNRPVAPAIVEAPRYSKWQNIALAVVKYLFIVEVLAGNIYQGIYRQKQMKPYTEQQKVYGKYEIVKPIDQFKWTSLTINKDSAVFGRSGLAPLGFLCNVDMASKQLFLFVDDDKVPHYKFGFKQLSAGKMVLDGNYQGINFNLDLLKDMDSNNNRLMTRGFHWINEYPYNR